VFHIYWGGRKRKISNHE